jgi:hypothetical protein
MASAAEKWSPGILVTTISPRLTAPVTHASRQQLLSTEQPNHPTSRLEAVVAASTEQAWDNLVATAVRRFGDHACALHRSHRGDYDERHDYDDQPNHGTPFPDPRALHRSSRPPGRVASTRAHPDSGMRIREDSGSEDVSQRRPRERRVSCSGTASRKAGKSNREIRHLREERVLSHAAVSLRHSTHLAG